MGSASLACRLDGERAASPRKVREARTRMPRLACELAGESRDLGSDEGGPALCCNIQNDTAVIL